MGKTALLAPLYVSVAWTFLVSYQLFTQTAVSTLVAYVNMIWPAVGGWLSLRIDLIVFVYAFAWVFLLSSVIPSVILGRERSASPVCSLLDLDVCGVCDPRCYYGLWVRLSWQHARSGDVSQESCLCGCLFVNSICSDVAS